MKQREEAFWELEKMRKKVPYLDYDGELASYREEKYESLDKPVKDMADAK